MDLESQAILSLYVIKNDLKKIPNYGIISKKHNSFELFLQNADGFK